MNAELLKNLIIGLVIAASAFNIFTIVVAIIHMFKNPTFLNLRDCSKDVVEALTWELIVVAFAYGYVRVMPIADVIINAIMETIK